VSGTKVLESWTYGKSTWGETAKVVAKLPSGELEYYFLKVYHPLNIRDTEEF
jgi:hypothetical protein